MSKFTLYHNPRCSKSREALQLLKDKGIEAEVVLYLENPPSVAELKKIVSKLGISAKALLRTKEDEYKALGLANEEREAAILQAMHEHPKLIERPILLANGKAALGRPPENILSIL
ncbi:MAG TPA: arsenate reductase (glutaredoxin) [Pseudomonadales bacterium]|nr:arsenate reductase (glutaredoxin) [Pseudomonadales bacterium]